MPFGVSHTVIRKLAYWTMKGFFSDTLIIDPENVPEDGPLIVCCTHWNMIVSFILAFDSSELSWLTGSR